MDTSKTQLNEEILTRLANCAMPGSLETKAADRIEALDRQNSDLLLALQNIANRAGVLRLSGGHITAYQEVLHAHEVIAKQAIVSHQEAVALAADTGGGPQIDLMQPRRSARLPDGCHGVSCDTGAQTVTLRFDSFQQALAHYGAINMNSPAAADAGGLLAKFDRDDLDGVADGLDCYEKTVNVGQVEVDVDTHLESTTAYAARFIRAYLAATPARPTAVMAGELPPLPEPLRHVWPEDDDCTFKCHYTPAGPGGMYGPPRADGLKSFPIFTAEHMDAHARAAMALRPAAMGAGDLWKRDKSGGRNEIFNDNLNKPGELPPAWGTWSDDDIMLTLYTQEQVLELLAARPAASGAVDLSTWPEEPTTEMQHAGATAIRFDTTIINKLWTANAVYRAMRAAVKGGA